MQGWTGGGTSCSSPCMWRMKGAILHTSGWEGPSHCCSPPGAAGASGAEDHNSRNKKHDCYCHSSSVASDGGVCPRWGRMLLLLSQVR